LAFDSKDNYSVLFGGSSNDTWVLKDGNWSELHPAVSPAAREDPALTYDSADGYVLLFGGSTDNGIEYNDTWTFSNGNWTELRPKVAPGTLLVPSMTYDPPAREVILFGGYYLHGVTLEQTWAFAGGNWTLLSPGSSPSARNGTSLVYDAAMGKLVLFGGLSRAFIHTGWAVNETWTFSNNSWSNVTKPTAPPADDLVPMVYDPVTSKVLAFFGDLDPDAEGFPASALAPETWEFSAGNWTELSPLSSPAPRIDPASDYDPNEGGMVLFGGTGPADALNDTRLFVSDNWSWLGPAYPVLRLAPSLAFDQATHAFMLFGGGGTWSGSSSGEGEPFLNDTWSYANGTWTEVFSKLSPSARTSAAMTYDAADGYLLLFGGQGCECRSNLGDTWIFAAGQWRNLSTNPSPGAAADGAMTFDSTDGYVVLFPGGGSTWTFHHGNWSMLNWPMETRYGASLADDPTDHGAILFGGTDANHVVEYHDTWILSGGAWTNVTQPGLLQPSGRDSSGVAYDPVGGYVLLFGGNSGTWLNDTWAFSNGNWTRLNTSNAPPAPTDSSFAFDPQQDYAFYYGAGPNGGEFHASPDWVLYPGAAPRLSATLSPASQSAVLGANLTWVASATAGAGSRGYSYASVPPGCPTSSVAVLSCTPNRTGQFRLEVLVADASGATTSAGAMVTILPRPSVTLSADPVTGRAPCPVLLNASVAFERPPIEYTWSFGDGNSTQGSLASITHLYQFAGSFEAIVVATNPAGASAVGYANITLEPQQFPLSLTATPAQTTITLGESARWTVSVSGGVGWHRFVWTGLPVGCVSTNASELNCTPAADGSYSVGVGVEDQIEEASNASLSLRVNPELEGDFQVSENSTCASSGIAVTLTATPIGGTPPDNFTWELANVSGLTYGPSVQHEYPIQATTLNASLRVIDSTGAQAVLIQPVRLVPPVCRTHPMTPGSNGTAPLPDWAWFLGGAAVGVVVGGSSLLLMLRRKNRA
jgi:hypothetical protein